MLLVGMDTSSRGKGIGIQRLHDDNARLGTNSSSEPPTKKARRRHALVAARATGNPVETSA